MVSFLAIIVLLFQSSNLLADSLDDVKHRVSKKLGRSDVHLAIHPTGLIEVKTNDGLMLYTNYEATGFIPGDVVGYLLRCAPTVHPTTMLRILRVESSGNPYAIGYLIRKNKATYHLNQQPRTKEEAQAWAAWLIQNGYRFDSGIAQVNSINFARTGLNIANAFEPCENLRAGAQILTDEYQRAAKQYGEGQKALFAAISAYQSGNFETGFRTGYVAKVTSPNNFPNFKIQAVQPPIRSMQ